MKNNQPFWPIMKIVGGSVFGIFSLVTCLVVAILAASNLISKYALKAYTEEQVSRLHEDAIVYQSKEIKSIEKMRSGLRVIPGVTKAGFVGVLRLRLGTGMDMEIGKAPVDLPWCVLLAFEDPSRLPAALRPPPGGVAISMISTQSVGI